ncbi:MAG TPA: outer membrane lipoprotein chaperone LolA [Woeseiaceae bacterium]|nr:outer membrane lipoprotein chaperone LolA [Woeseiaceae bacterium]
MPVMHTTLGGLIAASLLAAGASAAGAPPPDVNGEALIEDFIESVHTMRGRFEQSLVDASDTVVESSSGTFEIRRPGQLRWSYEQPYEQLLVADGRNVWSYDVDLAQVTVKPQAEVLSSTPALLLGGTRDVLEDFTYDGSFEDRGTEWVRLLPRDTDSNFESVELGFSDGTLTRMIFADNLDQTTLVAMHDVVLNEPIDPERFRFVPPGGVDVVGTPLED